MLTKKHFKAVAEVIKSQIMQYYIQERHACANGVESIAYHLADYFATQNPRFDRERFMKACGLINTN